jgi:hypothetical protein
MHKSDWNILGNKFGSFFELIKAEVELPYLHLFCSVADRRYLFKLEQHYNGFHPVNAPLVSEEYQV